MYKYIEQNEKFSDLKSDNAKNNYMRIMNCLDNITIPNIRNMPYIPLSTKTLNRQKFDGYLQYLCGKVFFDENTNRLSRELANNRMALDFGGYPFGYTSNDISSENIIMIEGCKYFISPLISIHELTHAISFINHAQIPEQYGEILSIFNEIRASREMDETTQDEWLFNKMIQRLKYRIYLKDLSDEMINSIDIDEDLYFQGYFRILNFVYALRLYELYSIYQEEISACVDRVLKNEINILELLKKYQISLESEDTIAVFEKIIDEYEQVVRKHFNKNRRNKQWT